VQPKPIQPAPPGGAAKAIATFLMIGVPVLIIFVFLQAGQWWKTQDEQRWCDANSTIQTVLDSYGPPDSAARADACHTFYVDYWASR
jgi:TM2 domain-containing membrane protein YozV